MPKKIISRKDAVKKKALDIKKAKMLFRIGDPELKKRISENPEEVVFELCEIVKFHLREDDV